MKLRNVSFAGKGKSSKATTLHQLPCPSQMWRRVRCPSGCRLTQLHSLPPPPRSIASFLPCAALCSSCPKTTARKQNGGRAGHYGRVEGNRMSSADRPAGLEMWSCNHDLLFLCCQQITAGNHQVPAPLIYTQDGSLPLAEV